MDKNPGARKPGKNLLPAVVLESKFRKECFFYRSELFGCRHPVRRRLQHSLGGLPLETRDTDHEKFVKVVCKDGQELHPFKERVPFVLCLFEHMVVETDPAQLTVDIERGEIQRGCGICHAITGTAR